MEFPLMMALKSQKGLLDCCLNNAALAVFYNLEYLEMNRYHFYRHFLALYLVY